MVTELCCLLCLESSNDPIEFDSKEGHNLNSREIIEMHFNQELLMRSQIEMEIVCQKCWQLVQSFHEFYLQVQQIHKQAATTLNKISIENETLDIKEDYEYIRESPTPPCRSRRPQWHQKLEDNNYVSNNTILPVVLSPLKEEQFKIEQLLIPASNSPDIMLSTTEIIDDNMDMALPEATSDTEEIESKYKAEPKSRSLGRKKLKRSHKKAAKSDKHISKKAQTQCRRYREPKKSTRIYKKTSESDEYIAKKGFQFSCSICQTALANFKELKAHFREKHKETRSYVLCCGKKLWERSEVIEHIHVHEDPDYFKCKHCGKKLSDNRTLELHVHYRHENMEPVDRCSICSKGFLRASDLKRHYNRHNTCLKCDKKFSNLEELKMHKIQTHSRVFVKVCDICGILIRGHFSFQRHLAQHEEVPQKLIKCDLCGSVLTTKFGLARHIKTMHTDEYQTPQVCPHCSKVSPTLQAHKNHIIYMHSLQRKHVCKLCDKAFKRSTLLKEHIAAAHTGEALYTCNFCSQTFKSSANMYAHRKKKHPKEWAELGALKKSSAISLKEALACEQ